jgi:hypothetical protein
MVYDNLDTVKSVGSAAVTANANKIEYDLLMRETAYATQILSSFETYLAYMDVVAEEAGIQMCSSQTAKKFAIEFRKLLEWYSDTLVAKTQKAISPTWYREQLHYYTGYIKAFLAISEMEAHRIKAERERINRISDREERKDQYEKLRSRYVCHSNV